MPTPTNNVDAAIAAIERHAGRSFTREELLSGKVSLSGGTHAEAEPEALPGESTDAQGRQISDALATLDTAKFHGWGER